MATTTKKKSSSGGSSSSGSGSRTLRNVVTSAAATETLIDLVERLGVVDLVVGRVKSKIEETDLDELFDEVADYMRRNPEVLVVSLGAITVSAALLVWLNNRREWDGEERRESSGSSGGGSSTSTGRVRKSA